MKLKVGKVILAVAMLVAILVTSVVPVIYANVQVTQLYDEEKDKNVALIGYSVQEDLAEAAWGIKSEDNIPVTEHVTKNIHARTEGIPYYRAYFDDDVSNKAQALDYCPDISYKVYGNVRFEPAVYWINETYTFSDYTFDTTGAQKLMRKNGIAKLLIESTLKTEALAKVDENIGAIVDDDFLYYIEEEIEDIKMSKDLKISDDNLTVTLTDGTEMKEEIQLVDPNYCDLVINKGTSITINGTITVSKKRVLTQLPEKYSQHITLEAENYYDDTDYSMLFYVENEDGTHTMTVEEAKKNDDNTFSTQTRDISGKTQIYLAHKIVELEGPKPMIIEDYYADDVLKATNIITSIHSTSGHLHLPKVSDPYHDDIVFEQINEPSTPEAKQELDKVVEDNNYNSVAYLNIEVDGGIPKVEAPIKFTIGIPSDIGEMVTYKVLRYHDGKVVILDTEIENGYIVFQSDLFSDYQLVYTDKVESESSDSDVDGADYANVSLFIVIAVISALAVLGIVIREKTFKEEN